jgi:tripartite-type tricarboxylate transporter receptor subunit TctC
MINDNGYTRRKFVTTSGGITLGLAIGSMGGIARAASYPTRDITWIVYQRAGGGIDRTTRAIQPFLKAQGVSTRIEYLRGAGGRIARAKLFTAKPDGYLMMTDATPGPALGEVVFNGAYKTDKFTPIFGWNREGWQLCVKKDSPLRNLKDLIALSKKRPIKAATIGRGGGSHLQLAILRNRLNLNINMAHFHGSSAAYPAVFGGHVDVAMSGPGSGRRNLDNLHFLSVFREGGEPLTLPGVPSAKDQGFDIPSIDQVWYAHTAPGVPKDRVQRLREAFEKAFAEDNLNVMRKQTGRPGLLRIPPKELLPILDDSYKLAVKFQGELKG